MPEGEDYGHPLAMTVAEFNAWEAQQRSNVVEPESCGQALESRFTVVLNAAGRSVVVDTTTGEIVGDCEDAWRPSGLSTVHIRPQVLEPGMWRADDTPEGPGVGQWAGSTREDWDRRAGLARRMGRETRGTYRGGGGSVPEVAEGPHLEAWSGGSLLRVSRGSVKCGSRPAVKRGKCGKFGGKSRRRLVQAMGKIAHLVLPLFLTLTYPDEFPVDWETWKRDLATFEKRLLRKFPGAALVWRQELKRRQTGAVNAGNIAPHFHCFIWGIPFCPEIQQWVSATWYETVRSGDERHLQAGTRLEEIRSWNGVMFYASKYIAKEDAEGLGEEFGHVGRWWGIVNRARIPWAVRVRVDLSRRLAVRLIRALDAFVRSHRRGAGRKKRAVDRISLSALVGDPDTWLLRLAEFEP